MPNCGELLGRLLNAVFADVTQASAKRRDDRLRRVRLRYADERDLLGPPPGMERGFGDAVAHARQILGDAALCPDHAFLSYQLSAISYQQSAISYQSGLARRRRYCPRRCNAPPTDR